ncbi:ribonuclease III [Georgenia thermotolerans]|uniref:Ribonuclease 3 n=1 Tax=Georgenia thermotolerans TaxID=527326 RepID=A0A7J5UQL8_9MICO|nr:ribonuclease III [Georgenia thermotolerans]KAE8764414.1 ribonuclease III [Georgenia thermotolerans]
MSKKKRGQVAEAPARQDVEALLQALGTTIDPELLVLALTHRSFAHEAGGIPTNERLEFLGDSVLGVIVTEYLYRHHPGVPEGDLARMRAATVSQRALAEVARDLALGEFILLGRGELVTGGREKDSILSDTVEALIGATYLCHGLEHTRAVVERLVGHLLTQAERLGAGLDWKTSLQELAAARGLGSPSYVVTGTGPDHARTFTAVVELAGAEAGSGVGSSKKLAEQNAAEDAYARLEAAGVEAADDATADDATGDDAAADDVDGPAAAQA